MSRRNPGMQGGRPSAPAFSPCAIRPKTSWKGVCRPAAGRGGAFMTPKVLAPERQSLDTRISAVMLQCISTPGGVQPWRLIAPTRFSVRLLPCERLVRPSLPRYPSESESRSPARGAWRQPPHHQQGAAHRDTGGFFRWAPGVGPIMCLRASRFALRWSRQVVRRPQPPRRRDRARAAPPCRSHAPPSGQPMYRLNLRMPELVSPPPRPFRHREPRAPDSSRYCLSP